ncbi:response regulator transcription factor [Kribbella antibiotica]|uniref:Response regulator transcription factor n=1 Tax=Kribbella antibiotica TaxID=190195 RepID=A0A4R4ZXL6_9ACTN|nr:response regulator transcription factor [Kribbella antibiotica]TDD61902.1 response regulator transcription factor [Kribbella antibiotica]
MAPVQVLVHSTESVTAAGLTSYLHTRPDIRVVDERRPEEADVLVFSTERLTYEAMAQLRQATTQAQRPTVLMASLLDDALLLSVIECGVVAILPRTAVTVEQLLDSIRAAAAGEAVMPREVVGKVLRSVGKLQRDVLEPNGLNLAGLGAREVDVLRMMADGWGTDQIARELQYSERTVKHVLSQLTTRLNLRNRAHAVAYAVRAGVI